MTISVDVRDFQALIDDGALADLAARLSELPHSDIAAICDLLPRRQRGIAFRVLPKPVAIDVFDDLTPHSQRELIDDLGTAEVAEAFDHLDPDDRAELLDELPAGVARALVQTLSPAERDLTGTVLGFPRGSVGRRMSPEFVHVYPDDPVAVALDRVRERGREAETIYTVPVVTQHRRLCGVVSLRDLLLASPETTVDELMRTPMYARVNDDAEITAQRCVDRGILAMPVTDTDDRLVGVLTIDDAVEVVEAARDTDEARAGAREPLRAPYMLASIASITRALAVGEIGPRDVLRVALKEIRVGLMLGVVLGATGFAVAAAVYELDIGMVIGLTIISVCTMAATIGGIMPLIAKSIHVDPAVFSTPFISTFCDATGLIIYFTIAKTIPHIWRLLRGPRPARATLSGSPCAE